MQVLIKSLIFLALIISKSTTFAEERKGNILAILPHISYSQAKETFKLIKELSLRGHNITFVTPYPNLVNNYYKDNITEIVSIEQILRPLKEFIDDFQANNNQPNSYWSKLKYHREVGYRYSKNILENSNFSRLIRPNATKFDLVILEDVGAFALATLSSIYRCPLIALLSEPVSIFYDNYFVDNSIRRQSNDLRTVHYWALKEAFRELFVIPDQNQLVKHLSVPDLRDTLYETSLVLAPSYETIGNLIPKYNNVKRIGGFHLKGFDRREKLEEKENNIVISNCVATHIAKQVQESFSPESINVIYTEQAVNFLRNSTVTLLINDGNVYETGLAFANKIPVLDISNNQWQQRFLIDAFVENYVAKQREPFNWINLITDIYKFPEKIIKPLSISKGKAMDEAIHWIEYIIEFEGAPHLRAQNLRSTIENRWITIIIVLVLVDLALFLIFYWIIKHLPRYSNYFVTMMISCLTIWLSKRRNRPLNMAYERIIEITPVMKEKSYFG